MKRNTIEYIGPRPRRNKGNASKAKWVMAGIISFGVGVVSLPLISNALDQQKNSRSQLREQSIAWLELKDHFGNRLASAALKRTRENVTYDSAYYEISYPQGDISPDKGVCTDVVIRSYRALGIDLQKNVHRDMKKNFNLYPDYWGAKKTDTNIDHRRVPNLQKFFSRFGKEIKHDGAQNAENFQYGDIVAWSLPNKATHIGVVVPGSSEDRDEKWIVHNIGSGPEWDDVLFSYEIIGHYRYSGER